jgi:hypothetical protein
MILRRPIAWSFIFKISARRGKFSMFILGAVLSKRNIALAPSARQSGMD